MQFMRGWCQATTNESGVKPPHSKGAGVPNVAIKGHRRRVGAGLVSAHLYIWADTRPAPTCGIPHCVMPVETDLLDSLRKAALNRSCPFVRVSIFPSVPQLIDLRLTLRRGGGYIGGTLEPLSRD